MSPRPVVDHLAIQARDVAASTAFYDAVLAPLGFRRMMEHTGAIGYGAEFPGFWIGPAEHTQDRPDQPVVGLAPHIAFTSPTREAVVAFFDAAVARGAEVLHEPRVWPEYHESYFGTFVRDPDGNNVEACCHQAP
jgi:catechol 2,3-dioxygenase-like lactoylglutathione lyase family enzyme